MARAPLEWERRIGRRLRLRDLYILSTVVRWGSMAKAAEHLAMSQPAVSESIANLEAALAVRLLDRSPQGVKPTIYADALLKRGDVVFDESHFGIVEEPGVATLIRKYRLHSLALGFLLLAGLFIWKNSLSFVPLDSETTELPYVEGRDAVAGFVNLLRRNIPQRDVLKVCFTEWAKSLGQAGIHSISRVDAAQTIFEAESARPLLERSSVRAYRDICAVLRGRKASAQKDKLSVPDPPKPTINS